MFDLIKNGVLLIALVVILFFTYLLTKDKIV